MLGTSESLNKYISLGVELSIVWNMSSLQLLLKRALALTATLAKREAYSLPILCGLKSARGRLLCRAEWICSLLHVSKD
jgi:hypothetical protein